MFTRGYLIKILIIYRSNNESNNSDQRLANIVSLGSQPSSNPPMALSGDSQPRLLRCLWRRTHRGRVPRGRHVSGDRAKLERLRSAPWKSWLVAEYFAESHEKSHMGLGQYLLIPFLGGWTSINPSYFDVNHRGTRFWHTAIYGMSSFPLTNILDLGFWISS